MPWDCISPLRSEAVLRAARYSIEHGIFNQDIIRHCLRKWDPATVWAVLREIERRGQHGQNRSHNAHLLA
jgi:hypothetical protein